MGHHAVVGAHRETLHVPAPHHGLGRLRLGEAAVGPHGLGHAGELRHGGHVADHHTAGGECGGHGVQALPGGEHVQDHAVHGAGLLGGTELLREVTEAQLPRGVRAAEHGLDVAACDLRELLAALERVHATLVPNRAQQGDAQRTRADPGLDHPGAREDVRHGHDLTRVLGVDHRRAAGHGEHEVLEQGAQRLVLDAGGVAHHGPLGLPDQLVVREHPAVRVVLPAVHQGDGGHLPALVRELDALPRAERPAPVGRAAHGRCGGGGGGFVGSLLGHLLAFARGRQGCCPVCGAVPRVGAASAAILPP